MEWLGWLALFVIGVLVILLVLEKRQNKRLHTRVFYAEKGQRDLMPQTQLAEQLRDNLLQSAQAGVLILDEDRRILFMNMAAGRLLGQVRVGETLMAATRNSDLDRLVGSAKNEQEEYIEFNRFNIRANVFPIQTIIGPMSLLFLHDETELRRLGRARRDMIANISHELRTPITTLNLLVETLLSEEGDKGNKKLRKTLKDMQRQIATLTQLVQEMRDLSKIESGQMPVRLVPFNLHNLVQNSIEPLMSIAESKEQIIAAQIPDKITVLVDASQIERVIQNIVHNAIKFTPQRGKITIQVEQGEEEVTLRITDTGIGISQENMGRIFERFFQEDNARVADGTGLGLAIARHIVLAHGGRIWVESEHGKGSTFYFTLPLVTDEDALIFNEP